MIQDWGSLVITIYINWYQPSHDHIPSLLDLLLTTHPGAYQVSVNAPLGSSYHCLVRSTVPLNSTQRLELGTRHIWHYQSADWNVMRSFFASYPWWQVCFTLEDPDALAESVADVITAGNGIIYSSSAVPNTSVPRKGTTLLLVFIRKISPEQSHRSLVTRLPSGTRAFNCQGHPREL